MGTTTRPKARTVRARKNMRLDQNLIDEAKRALNTDSDTEAVTIALQRVVHNSRVVAGLRKLAGSRIIHESFIND